MSGIQKEINECFQDDEGKQQTELNIKISMGRIQKADIVF